jgi:hypothetical protein
VAEEGWQGAQIALIAARAKVATGSVYRHFTSKADSYGGSAMVSAGSTSSGNRSRPRQRRGLPMP